MKWLLEIVGGLIGAVALAARSAIAGLVGAGSDNTADLVDCSAEWRACPARRR
jgi:prophage tail gpP-like protein